MGQVKGKGANLTLEPSAVAGGRGRRRSPQTMHAAAAGTPDPRDSGGEGSGDERRGRGSEKTVRQNNKPVEISD